MAVVGMRYPIFAPITAETEGAAITYGETNTVIAKAIRANITYNRNDNPLYADDTIAENDTGITSVDIELEIDKLTDDARIALLGDNAVTGNDVTVVEQTDASAPYGGFGFMRVLIEGGVKKYQGVWFHKVQFYEPSEETNTKGESIEWGTPTLNASGMGVRIDDSGKIKYSRRRVFDNAADCITWLNGHGPVPGVV